MSLEHQVECARLGELAILHLLRAVTLLELIGTKPSLADGAVDKRIAEVGEVSTRFERLRRVQDRCIDKHHVIAHLHDGAHPGVFHVAQHQCSERAVVVTRAEAPINLGTGERKPATLGKVDDLLEIFRRHCVKATEACRDC